MKFPEMQQKNPKKIFLFKIIVFEQGSSNSYILEQDTCHWQSICYQATQRFNMSLRVVYSKPGSLRVMKKQDESTPLQILQVFGAL